MKGSDMKDFDSRRRRFRYNPFTKRRQKKANGALASGDKEAGSQFALERVVVSEASECSVCLAAKTMFFQLKDCHHEACGSCWLEYLHSKITSFQMADMACFACDQLLAYQTVFHTLRFLAPELREHTSAEEFRLLADIDEQALIERYDAFLFEQFLRMRQDVHWCPNGCGFGVLAKDCRKCPRILCQSEKCEAQGFCFNCHGRWDDEETPHLCRVPSVGLDAWVDQAPRGGLLNNWGIIQGLRGLMQQMTGAGVSEELPRMESGGNYASQTVPVSTTTTRQTLGPRVSLDRQSDGDTLSFMSCNSTLGSGTPNGSPQLRPSSSTHEATVHATSGSLLRQKRAEQRRAGTDRDIVRPGTPMPIRVQSQQPQQQQDQQQQQSASQPQAAPPFLAQQSATLSQVTTDEDSVKQGQMKQCPKCKTYVLKLKDGSCNHMNCSICKCEFCWLCLREINCLHYVSPSGCTFWGRQPWSLRKRTLLVFGLAISTPALLLILLAVMAPCVMVGLPILAVNSTLSLFSGKPAHIRYIAAAVAAILSIPTAPIVTTLACGVGVVAFLFYVYCYMPVASARYYLSQRRAERQKRAKVRRPSASSGGGGGGDENSPDVQPPATIDWSQVMSNEQGARNLDWDQLAKASEAGLYQNSPALSCV